jgi:Zn-dependent protease
MNDLGYRWLSFAGVPLYWHPTVLWIPCVAVLSLLSAQSLAFVVMTAALVTAFALLSILLHEAAHVVVARRSGIRPYAIVLHGVGGLALVDVRAGSRRQRIVVSLAGPFANLAIAALCAGGVWAIEKWNVDPEAFELEHMMTLADRFPVLRMSQAELLAHHVLRSLVWINLALGLVNLLPCYPLDGGRILYTALRDHLKPRLLHRLIGTLGLISGYCVIGAGTMYGWGLAVLGIALMAISGWVIWRGRSFG